MDYIEEIEQFYIQLTSHGVSLSPAEIKLIVEWRERGIPKKVICKALMKRVYLSREFLLERKFRLTRFKKDVENEFLLYKKRMDGIPAHPETLAADSEALTKTGVRERLTGLAAKLKDMASDCACEPQKSLVAALYERTASKIEKILELIDDEATMMEMAINAIDSMPADFLATLDKGERDDVLKELDESLARNFPRIGRKAFEEKKREILAEIIVRKFSLKLPGNEVFT